MTEAGDDATAEITRRLIVLLIHAIPIQIHWIKK